MLTRWSDAAAYPPPARARAINPRKRTLPSRRIMIVASSGQEQLGRDRDATILEAVQELWAKPRRLELSQELPVLVDPGFVVEQEDVLKGDDLSLHPDHLGQLGHSASAVLQASLM